MGALFALDYGGGCSVTSADFQHQQRSRVLRSVYSEVPEALETTYDEDLQTSGMHTLHTHGLLSTVSEGLAFLPGSFSS